MDYNKIYITLINKAISREYIDGYFEWHHILPKSLGGSDDISNTVRLTFREHYIAHLLLAKIFGGTSWFSVECFYHFQRKMRIPMQRMPKWLRRKLHLTRLRMNKK